MPIYGITTLKGLKLKEGDPASRGGCKLNVDNQGLRTYTCENTSIAELADKLRGVAGGYLNHPVVDLSGLKGVYNFAISWNAINRTRPTPAGPREGGAGAAATESVNAASNPGGGITFFQGAEKIGLRFNQEKHPMQVLVIDKVQRTPVEN